MPLSFRLFSVSVFWTIALFIQSEAKAIQVSPYFGQVVSIAPSDGLLSEIPPGSDLSFRIDSLVLKILSTKSGSRFCEAVSERQDIFRRAFFINDNFATKGFEVCRGRLTRKFAFLPFPKRYFLITTNETDFAADGWTTPRNETFLFINQGELTDERISRTLIHELAVSYDGKELFGFGGFTSIAPLGIEANQTSCSILPIVRNGFIKQTLSAIRAFDLERKIGEELGFSLPPRFANWNGKSCVEKIVFMSEHMRRFENAVAAEMLVNSLMDVASCSAPAATFRSVEEAAQILDRAILSFSDGKTKTACDYFTDGIDFVPGTSFRGGPGPRIGGGGW